MNRGGKREGAGRPKGAVNKATASRQAEIAASGLTPLDFMLNRMRDESMDEEARFEAAKAAAPYVHPRLAATEIKGELQVNDVSSEPEKSEVEWAAEHGHA